MKTGYRVLPRHVMEFLLLWGWIFVFGPAYPQNPDSSSTSSAPKHRGVYAGFNAGISRIAQNFSVEEERCFSLCYQIGLGYFVHDKVQLGVKFAGWAFRSTRYDFSLTSQPAPDRHSFGAKYMYAALYPLEEERVFIKAGLGRCTYRNREEPAEAGSGNSMFAALGYEKSAIGNSFIGAQLTYHNGRLDDAISRGTVYSDRHYHAVDLTITMAIEWPRKR